MGEKDKVTAREEVYERLKALIMNLLKIMKETNPENRPKLSWDTDLINDLGVDSMETLDLMNAIEEEFQISPNLNEANSKRKICQIVDYIIELSER